MSCPDLKQSKSAGWRQWSVVNVWAGAGGEGVGACGSSPEQYWVSPQPGNISISARGSASALGTRLGTLQAQQRGGGGGTGQVWAQQ